MNHAIGHGDPTSRLDPSHRSRPHPRRAARATLLGTVGALALAAACTSEGELAGTAGDYVLSATIFNPEGASSYLRFIEDPGAQVEIGTEGADEVGGAAALFGFDGQRAFGLGTSDGPVVTRYSVTDDGALVEGESFSMAGGGSNATGISSAFKRPGLVPFVSPTKAYFLDDVTMQGVIWNPEAMTLTGTFSLADAARDGLVFELAERAVLRDDGMLFVAARYRTGDDLEAGVAVALVVDTSTDTLVDVLEDDRCGDSAHIVEAPDGTLYFGTGTIGAVLYALGRPEDYPAPCLLRIVPGESDFDESFHVELPSLVGDRAAGRLVAGPDGRAYVLALNEELLDAPLGPETEVWTPWEASAWEWWQIDLGSEAPGMLVAGAPVASGGGWALTVGDRQIVTQIDYETGRTTLLVPQDGGGFASGAEIEGVPYGLVRLD